MCIRDSYKFVRQEYIPSGVDEGEFEVQVTAPEGTSLSAMNEVMQAIEKDVRGLPNVTVVLASAGSGFLGGVNQGDMYVRLAPHEERLFTWSRLLHGVVTLDPLEAFRNNYSQQRIMQMVRANVRKYKDLRCGVSNIQSFNFGGGRTELDLALRGPDLEALAKYGDALRLRAPELGMVDADITLKLNKPELQVQICLLYTSPSPRDRTRSRMPSSA